MKNTLIARAAILGVSAVSAIAVTVAPTAGATLGQWVPGCPADYILADHLDRGLVCGHPANVDGNGILNGVAASIEPPAFIPLDYLDTDRGPCGQVAPWDPCSAPWVYLHTQPSWGY